MYAANGLQLSREPARGAFPRYDRRYWNAVMTVHSNFTDDKMSSRGQ